MSLDGLLDLLVAHSLDASRMFNFHIPRAQPCQQLAVSRRLVLAHFGNCRWTAVPKVSQQCRNKLAIQLLTVTRADRTAGRVLRAAQGGFPLQADLDAVTESPPTGIGLPFQ